MTINNLSASTTDLIQSFGNSAKNVVGAYRFGGERFVNFADQRVINVLEGSEFKINGKLISVQKTVSGYYAKGLTTTAEGAEQLIAKIVELASKGVQLVATNAQRFEGMAIVKPLNQIALGAKLVADEAVVLAKRLEEQTERLAGKKAKPVKAVAKVAVKRTGKRATKATKAAATAAA